MIKTIKVKIPAKKEKVVEKKIYICDLCKKEFREYYYIKKCFLCKREICIKCRKDDPFENGDYPDEYCKHCYNLKFIKYIKEFDEIEKDYDKKTEALEQKIKKESLEIKL